MKTPFLIMATLSTLFLSGCASQSINSYQPFQSNDLNALIESGSYEQKTQTFFVINDSSSSMSDIYSGTEFSSISKHSVEKEILNRMNKTIPDLALSSGLRSFGYGPCTSWAYTELNQNLQNYSPDSFQNAINSLTCSSGGTPPNDALLEANSDLSAAQGNIAVILLSDGHQYTESPVAAVESLKQQYGDKLCLYTIWVGNEKEATGQDVLAQLAETSGCGFSTTANNLASNTGMAQFVTDVFLKKAAPKDSDKDGILDCHDQCPTTPIGATVNEQGCWVIQGVHFDTNKSDIKAQYHAILNNVVTVIQQNPGLKIEIQGHTDNQGSAAYNLSLSDRRAKAIRDYLSSQVGSAGVLTAKGYGLSTPIDSNDTELGRFNNRRVQLKVLP